MRVQLLRKFSLSFSSYVVGIALTFFLLHRLLFLHPGIVETTVSYAVYPFLLIQKSIVDPIVHWQNSRKSAHEFTKELVALQEQNSHLQAELVALQAQKQFLTETHELRCYKGRYKIAPHCLAQVIFKQLNTNEQFFLLDCGSNKGVAQDMIAVYKNCLLGRITQVFPQYSKVTLITDKRSNVAAFCATTRSDGIAEGVNADDLLKLKFVSHLQKVQKDDRVLSSGQGLVFPHGFGIGTVTDYYVDGLYYNVTVAPLVDMQAVQYCYVIQKGDG